MFDVVCALLLALAALPLGLLIAGAIVLESPGRVFFAHARIGVAPGAQAEGPSARDSRRPVLAKDQPRRAAPTLERAARGDEHGGTPAVGLRVLLKTVRVVLLGHGAY